MIKVGQIYQAPHTKSKRVVTYTEEDLGLLYSINKDGVSYACRYNSWNDYKLIAEYPTWQEAVNSKEFKND